MKQISAYRCDSLGSNPRDEIDIMSFESRGKGRLADYLRYSAFPDEDSGDARTYLVRDANTEELACHFSLKAGVVSQNEDEKGFDLMPGVEISHFAVNQKYVELHQESKGLGLIVFQNFIIPIITDAAKHIGIKTIYVFAIPDDRLIERYEEYGFRRLAKSIEQDLHKRLKPRYDESCIFMYQSL